jgi:peptidyl-prolyl cis-trans isomerase C
MQLGIGLLSSWRGQGWYFVCAVAVSGVLSACGRQPGPTSTIAVTQPPAPTVQAAQSVTPPPTAAPVPTATPEPLALTVNGQNITLAEYDSELARCQAGKTSAAVDASDCPAAVLSQLTKQAIVEQAAATAGITVTQSEVDANLNTITAKLGGPGALIVWLAANKYQSSEFRAALRADLLRARMVDKLTAGVGPTAEQVHAREILVTSSDTAQAVLTQLQAGADYATLALQYSRDLSSRAGGGDLGWFPRGVLTVPEVEQAAFSLQPGQISGVIHSALGYHIIQVLERDPQRPLSPGDEQTLRAAAYTAWLNAQMAKAVVVNHINP